MEQFVDGLPRDGGSDPPSRLALTGECFRQLLLCQAGPGTGPRADVPELHGPATGGTADLWLVPMSGTPISGCTAFKWTCPAKRTTKERVSSTDVFTWSLPKPTSHVGCRQWISHRPDLGGTRAVGIFSYPMIMKTKDIPTCMAALLLWTAACPATGLAQQSRAGGYARAPVTHKEVAAAAAFAIKAQQNAMQDKKDMEPPKLELASILQAEQQVVAGMNYRLKLKVKLNGKEQTAEAIVWWQAWRKPEPYQLTSWTWK